MNLTLTRIATALGFGGDSSINRESYQQAGAPLNHRGEGALVTASAVQKKIVEVAGGTTITGLAAPGTATSEAKWQLRKDVVSGGTTTTTWGRAVNASAQDTEAIGGFNLKWDDRSNASLVEFV